MAPRYRHLGITLLADSLYAVHPFVELGCELQIFDVQVAAGEELRSCTSLEGGALHEIE